MAVPEGKASPEYLQKLFKTFSPPTLLSAGILILAKKGFFAKYDNVSFKSLYSPKSLFVKLKLNQFTSVSPSSPCLKSPWKIAWSFWLISSPPPTS